MRIDVSSSSFHPSQSPLKGRSDLQELMNRGENVRGKIVDVNLSYVLIRSSDGKEYVANTTVPLENFIGEEMMFTILQSPTGEILLKPVMGEDIKKKEANLKIEDLLNKMNLPLTKENKDILREMIRQNLPITLDSFKEIKNIILSGDLLDAMMKDLEFLKQGIESKDVPLGNLIRNMLNKNPDLDIDGLPNDPKIFDQLKEDVVFLFKNKIPVNLGTLNAWNLVKSGEENLNDVRQIGDLYAQLAESLETSSMTDVEKEEFKLELFKKLGTTMPEKAAMELTEKESLGLTLSKKEEPDSQIKDVNLKVLKEVLENEIKNLKGKIEQSVRPELLKEELLDIPKEEAKFLETLDKNISKIKETLGEENPIFKELSIRQEFVSKIMNENLYFQLPFQYRGQEKVLEFLLESSGRKKQGDGKSINVVISINTNSLKRVEALISYQEEKRELNLNFRLENDKLISMFKTKEQALRTVIESLGLKLGSVSYKEEINSPLIQKALEKNPQYPGFETWV